MACSIEMPCKHFVRAFQHTPVLVTFFLVSISSLGNITNQTSDWPLDPWGAVRRDLPILSHGLGRALEQAETSEKPQHCGSVIGFQNDLLTGEQETLLHKQSTSLDHGLNLHDLNHSISLGLTISLCTFGILSMGRLHKMTATRYCSQSQTSGRFQTKCYPMMEAAASEWALSANMTYVSSPPFLEAPPLPKWTKARIDRLLWGRTKWAEGNLLVSIIGL